MTHLFLTHKATPALFVWTAGALMLLVLICAHSPMSQAQPQFHLVGLAATTTSHGQLVEVGQILDPGGLNATVKISSSEIFLDIGTGAIQGTIHWALEFDSSRCGKIIEDITYALTGTFDKTTKQFSATSTESRHYTIISPGDSTDFCKDVSFPSSDFVGVLEDDDKTISVYGCNGVGVACSFGDVGPGALRGRVSSDVPINLCSAGNAAQAVSEHRISTNDQPPPKCFEPPSITSVTAPAEWVLEKGTIVKVSFRNPGKRKILSVSLVGGVSGKGISQDVNVGGKEIGSFTIKEACGDLNHFVFGVIISNQDGDSNEASLNVNCILPKSDPPSVGAQPTLTKQQKDAFLKTAAAAEELAYGVAVLAVIGACPGLKEKAKSTCQDSLVALALRLFDYASEKRKLAADPPDPNYTEIAQPVTPPFTPITTQDPTLQKFVDAFNALLLNQAQTIGLDEALLHAMERAQGAYQAHDAFWQFQQLNAAAQFASQLATLLKAQTTLPSTIQKEWKNAGVPNISLTKDDVARLQNSINTQGFPKEILDALAKLNVNQATIDQLKQQLLAQPPQALAGTFPAKLNDPKLNSATQAVASGFTQMASKSCKVNVSADLSFVRFDEDVARYFAFLPDGKKDGHFQLTLTRPNSSNLIYLKLETANTNNRPAFSQGWDTDLNTDWMLGLEDAKGKKLNPTDKKISISVNKTATFELFANDSGYFKNGQHFIVTAFFQDGCVAQASTVITAPTTVLKVDDGSYELSVGFPTGTARAYFVNRLTPPSYPATLQNIQIHFTNRADGLKQNDAITLLVGTNSSGNTNIDSVTFQQISAKVKALDQFDQYDTTAVTINSGDFVVGFLTKNPKNIFPMDEDTTAPSQGRSYLSSNGVNFSLVDSFANLAGNFAIRATASLPVGTPTACFSNVASADSVPTLQSTDLSRFVPMPAGVRLARPKETILDAAPRVAEVCEAHSVSLSAVTDPQRLLAGIAMSWEGGKLILTVREASAPLRFMLFNLSGRKLLDHTSQSPVLTLPAAMEDGRPLANGVYLYVVDVRSYSGKLIRSEVRKLIISR